MPPGGRGGRSVTCRGGARQQDSARPAAAPTPRPASLSRSMARPPPPPPPPPPPFRTFASGRRFAGHRNPRLITCGVPQPPRGPGSAPLWSLPAASGREFHGRRRATAGNAQIWPRIPNVGLAGSYLHPNGSWQSMWPVTGVKYRGTPVPHSVQLCAAGLGTRRARLISQSARPPDDSRSNYSGSRWRCGLLIGCLSPGLQLRPLRHLTPPPSVRQRSRPVFRPGTCGVSPDAFFVQDPLPVPLANTITRVPCTEPCGSPVAESEGEEEAGALTQTAAPAALAAPAATAPSMADHYDVEGQALGMGLGAGAAPAAPRPPPTANAVLVPSLIERPPEVDKKVKAQSVQRDRGPPPAAALRCRRAAFAACPPRGAAIKAARLTGRPVGLLAKAEARAGYRRVALHTPTPGASPLSVTG
ncbi:WAS/WASL-interacting protein family member 1-like [Schistocerca americana]|uniref:WAS/WASL-interacting protein family member 1-like n=1 Tax=Schistocerca americana TaxID=7009 RepID=UPI001F4F6C42|nr:WAS/WASL-interacting protein family member 1-like [Schistocerca americana]